MAIGRLDGKVAIITGAAGGIGSATARLLAAERAAVILADVRAEDAAAVVGQITAAGGAAIAARADVSDEDQVRALIGRAVTEFGGLDIVVNNAGMALHSPLAQTALADFEAVLAVNLSGPFLMMKHAAAAMRDGGSIVNISSVAAVMAVRGAAAYTAAKGGLLSLTRVSAAEFGPRIRVNCVCPGTVRTEMPEELLRTRGDGDAEAGARLTAQRYLSGRLGLPEEIAATVLFLAGPEGSFCTGTVLIADGGVTAQ